MEDEDYMQPTTQEPNRDAINFPRLFEDLTQTIREQTTRVVLAIVASPPTPPEPTITSMANPPSCEWRRDRYSDDLYQTNCGKEFRGSSIWNYCPECGKVIFNV